MGYADALYQIRPACWRNRHGRPDVTRSSAGRHVYLGVRRFSWRDWKNWLQWKSVFQQAQALIN